MTIVHVAPYYAPAWAWGGVVEAVAGIARTQAAVGHRVAVLTTDTLAPGRRGPVGRQRIEGVEVIRVPTRWPALRARLNLSWTRGLGGAVRQLVAEWSPDVLHCHEPRTVEALLAARVAGALGVPVVVSPHGTLPLDTGRGWAKRTWDRLFARAGWRSVAHVAALSEAEAEEVSRFARRWGLSHLTNSCSVVPNGVDLERFASLPAREAARASLGVPPGPPVVLFLGRLHERKGLPLLVDACGLARDRGVPMHLVIAGPDAGARRAVQRRIAETRLASVTLHGLLTGDAKLAAFAAADVFALPARGEGLPMAALEALASGVPVVTALGNGLDEIGPAGAGRIVARDAGSLVAALDEMLADPSRRAAMSAAARALAATRYSCARVVAQLDEVYRLARSQAHPRPSQP